MDIRNIYRPTWAEINLAALEYNYLKLKNSAGKHVKILSVVKADAYGHGLIEVARRLSNCGTNYLGVASIDEAICLRHSNIRTPVLVFGNIFKGYEKAIVDYNLTQTIFTKEAALSISRYAKKKNKAALVHIKVDTGMGRLGIWHEEALDFIKEICSLPNIKIEGLYSHLSCADSDPKFTFNQIRLFDNLIRSIKTSRINIPSYHLANSIGIIDYESSHYNMARAGVMLYGIYPKNSLRLEIKLNPVMSFKSKIIYVKRVPPGRSISYGRTFITKKSTLVATIPVGYKDGYFRNLSNKAKVLVGGKYCNIIGRVCMDQTMIDVSSTKNVTIGDEVILIGSDSKKAISAEDIAYLAGTIGYEVVCSIGSSVPRIYKG